MKLPYFLFFVLISIVSCKDIIETDQQTFPTVFEESKQEKESTVASWNYNKKKKVR